MTFQVIISVIIAADLLWWFRADARLRRLRRPRPWRVMLACFAAPQTFYVILWLAAPPWLRGGSHSLPLPLHVLAYLWHTLVLPLLCLDLVIPAARRWSRRRSGLGAVAAPGGRAARPLWRRRRERADESKVTPAPPVDSAPAGNPPRGAVLSRRQLMSAAAVALPPLAAAAVSARAIAQLGEFRVRNVDLSIPDLPPDLHGLTIAHVTDIHLGRFTRDGMAGRVADATNALSPDLIVFSGDLIDYSQDDLPAGIDFIRRLQPRHGPKGLVMIEGNHDLMEYGPGFEQKVRDAGLPLLIDEARTVQIPGRRTPIQWLGLCWGQPDGGPRERLEMTDQTIAGSMARVLPLRRSDAFPILLTHHPHAFDPAAAAGLPLTLAGHTHGGQIMLTEHIGAGPLRFRYWAGLYRRAASQLFVCNGVGNWFPLRVNAPAEVVQLTLHRG